MCGMLYIYNVYSILQPLVLAIPSAVLRPLLNVAIFCYCIKIALKSSVLNSIRP